MNRRTFVSAAVFSATAAVAQKEPIKTNAGEIASTDGLVMQEARARAMTARGKKIAYTKVFDLSGLPSYRPAAKVGGAVRLMGSNYITDGMVGGFWEDEFRTFHPDVRISWNMKTSRAAVPSLTFGISDIGIGRRVDFGELQNFQRHLDRSPIEIEIATGSYDVPGWQPGYGVVVNTENPLDKINMEQLDGVFGAERAGGWDGTDWHPEWARGPGENIRTWGQLGLTGPWADRAINVYGLNLRYHQATELSDMLLKGSDKWNEKLKIYANFVSTSGSLERGMNEDLALDKYGIAIIAAPTTNLSGGAAKPSLKILPVAPTAKGPHVAYTLETIQDRSYPMFDQIWAYADRPPGQSMSPATLEFLRYIISREGQAAVMRDGKYLPLTAAVAREQLAKLDAAAT